MIHFHENHLEKHWWIFNMVVTFKHGECVVSCAYHQVGYISSVRDIAQAASEDVKEQLGGKDV